MVLADDSGLFCQALNGDPGVHSARYAGEPCNDKNNNDLLIKNLQGKDRTAEFRSTICLIEEDGKASYFTGTCKGQIIDEPRGDGGFGYDPYFLPDGETKTFAQMSAEEKNKISHRRRALEQLKEYLKDKK